MSKGTRSFALTALVWTLVVVGGTIASQYYMKWVVQERRRADEQMQALELQFKGKWQEALDTCADTPAVDDYVNRVSWLYRMKFSERLQHIDDLLRKKHPRTDLALDAFSGYCVLRSREFQTRLTDQDIRIHLVDDKAEYSKRIQTLQSGDTPLAVFTVDALINNAASLESVPAVIVMAIDESRGADALVSYRDALPDIEAMNREDVKIVLVPDSPSVTLARLVQHQSRSPEMPKEWFIDATDMEDVAAQFKRSRPDDRMAFALWEPYVSQLLQEYPQAHKLISSANDGYQGYIVDVLVAQKKYLRENREVVEGIVKAYLEALAAHQREAEGMTRLVQADSVRLAEAGKMPKALTYQEAEQVVKGIRWSNTQENYIRFGLLPAGQVEEVQPLETTIKKVTTLLKDTKTISRPVNGPLVDKEVCASLQKENFDENKGSRVIPSPGPFDPQKEWDKLQPVTTVKLEPILFRRHVFELSQDNMETLQEVAKSMKSLSDYYLEVQPIPRGETEADMDLARKRADAVIVWLRDQGGVEPQRMKTRILTSTEGGGTVAFVILSKPK